MDNENKINKTDFNAPKVVSNFLKEDLSLKAKTPEVYSLDNEFAKTRKNKAYSIYILITLFVLLTVGFTYFITYTIQKKNENLKIDISDFKDINLKDLLAASKELGSQIKLLEKEITYLQETRNKEIAEAKDEANANLRILWAKNLAKDESQKEEKKIKNREWGSIRKINNKYQTQINEKQKKLARLRIEYKEQDKKLSSGVKKTEEVLHSYGKVHELKMERMRKFYEDKLATQKALFEKRTKELKSLQKTYSDNLILRFNPKFKEEILKNVLKTEKDTNILSADLYKEYSSDLKERKIFPEGNFEQLRKNIVNFILLINRLDQIPYTNSVDPSIDYLNYFFRSIVKEYEERWFVLGNKVVDQHNQLQLFRKAFVALSTKNQEDGYIVGESKGIVEFVLNPFFSVKEGQHALVFSDGVLKAEIVFFYENNRAKAKIINRQAGRSIEAFDGILIKRSVPKKTQSKPEESNKNEVKK